MHPLDETTLRRLYLDEQQTIRAIAQELGVRNKTVSDGLKHFGIPLRPPGARPTDFMDIDAATLRQLYIEERSTIREIAQQYQVSYGTVQFALARAGIPRRNHGARRDRPPPTPDVLAAVKGCVADYGITRTAHLLKISHQKLYALVGQRPKWRGTRRRLDDAAVRVAYDQGMKVAELAEQWNCHPRTIERSLQRTYIRPTETSSELGMNADQTGAKLHESPFHEV